MPQNPDLPISEPGAGAIHKACEVDGCTSGRWFAPHSPGLIYVCRNHEGYEACSVLTIGYLDEDFTLIDGCEYIIEAKLVAMSKHMRVLFVGTFKASESTPLSLRFEAPGGSYVVVPESTIRSIIAH